MTKPGSSIQMGRSAAGLLVIDGATVEALVDLAQSIDLAEASLRKTSNGGAGTCLSAMVASLADRAHAGAKVQSVFPLNFDAGLPSHQGGVLLFDKTQGRPAATRALSRPESSELAIIGYGEQAERHIATIASVRPISRVRVWGRDARKAKMFADALTAKGFPVEPVPTARDAVAAADIVCTVTSARLLVLNGEWLAPARHPRKIPPAAHRLNSGTH